MLPLDVCHSSQSDVVNSFTGIAFKFKCWWLLMEVSCVCVGATVAKQRECMCWWGVSMSGGNVRRWLSLMEHQLTLEKYSCL